jgi:alkanesulfonate monooxygenase SsuD/methylene tetrahydromethanopterin reductase-like flavin-dependent oxidoreductase (luciferase family)
VTVDKIATVLVGRSATTVRRLAETGIARFVRDLAERGRPVPDGTAADLLLAFDVFVGTPDDVAAQLAGDPVADAATDVMVQVHPADPGQQATLESLHLFAQEVAPALGWTAAGAGRRLAAVMS